ncbi:MAG: YodL domain-containing protein, partial [Eubacteriales bacterium]|nr:YodL domain-containing protein [Eubacteriales bacterium]
MNTKNVIASLIPQNGYAILQLKEDLSEYYGKAFSSYEQVVRKYGKVSYEDYHLIYAARSWTKDKQTSKIEPLDQMEELFERFNNCIPDDFTGHSISVSDVVALRDGDAVDAWYVNT